ncbi:hypothetical protein Metlim_1061 [Methanoplanus limicola DSM 2279]|uniref:Uncharacterized protein n=1 Tax=Methanoplanus limicola DSM 2279 TaxID=937775 RepID=H1YZW8_9EURY|nr:hypothetical protein Metlim_1061 [Methanoplanus limicola DSM 2279]
MHGAGLKGTIRGKIRMNVSVFIRVNKIDYIPVNCN